MPDTLKLAWAMLAWGLVAGCATVNTPETTAYLCAEGRGFRLLTQGDDARMVLDGMKFDLRREAAAGGVTRYTCNMLSVELQAGVAAVDLEGAPHLRQCRPRR